MADAEPDTFVDGCGVLHDIPIGEGVRIRFKLVDDRQQDISVFVQDGQLHIYGQYRPLVLALDGNNNHVRIETQVWTTKKEENS